MNRTYLVVGLIVIVVGLALFGSFELLRRLAIGPDILQAIPSDGSTYYELSHVLIEISLPFPDPRGYTYDQLAHINKLAIGIDYVDNIGYTDMQKTAETSFTVKFEANIPSPALGTHTFRFVAMDYITLEDEVHETISQYKYGLVVYQGTFSIEEPPPTPKPPPSEPTITYNLTVKVKDQAGNILSNAQVDFGGLATKTTDNEGKASHGFTEAQTVNVKASFTKFGRTFRANKTVTVDANKTVAITVQRLFHWNFHIYYDDGSRPSGELTLTSSGETVVVSITNGEGEAWLNNVQYSVTWKASPETSLGSLLVTNDGDLTYRLTVTTDPFTGEIIVVNYTTTTETEGEVVKGEPITVTPIAFTPLTMIIFVIILVGLVVAIYLVLSRRG
jgi:hypothetical protein